MLENLRAAMVPAQISRLPENACARKVNEKPSLANIPVKVPLKMLQQKKSRCDCVVNITSVKDGLRLLPRKNIETINNLTVLYIYIYKNRFQMYNNGATRALLVFFSWLKCDLPYS